MTIAANEKLTTYFGQSWFARLFFPQKPPLEEIIDAIVKAPRGDYAYEVLEDRELCFKIFIHSKFSALRKDAPFCKALANRITERWFFQRNYLTALAPDKKKELLLLKNPAAPKPAPTAPRLPPPIVYTAPPIPKPAPIPVPVPVPVQPLPVIKAAPPIPKPAPIPVPVPPPVQPPAPVITKAEPLVLKPALKSALKSVPKRLPRQAPAPIIHVDALHTVRLSNLIQDLEVYISDKKSPYVGKYGVKSILDRIYNSKSLFDLKGSDFYFLKKEFPYFIELVRANKKDPRNKKILQAIKYCADHKADTILQKKMGGTDVLRAFSLINPEDLTGDRRSHLYYFFFNWRAQKINHKLEKRRHDDHFILGQRRAEREKIIFSIPKTPREEELDNILIKLKQPKKTGLIDTSCSFWKGPEKTARKVRFAKSTKKHDGRRQVSSYRK